MMRFVVANSSHGYPGKTLIMSLPMLKVPIHKRYTVRQNWCVRLYVACLSSIGRRCFCIHRRAFLTAKLRIRSILQRAESKCISLERGNRSENIIEPWNKGEAQNEMRAGQGISQCLP